MKTFYSIIQRNLNATRYVFPNEDKRLIHEYYLSLYKHEEEILNRNPFLILTWYDAIFYFHLNCKPEQNTMAHRTKTKFEILQGVTENMFFSVSQKEEFFASFSKVQKIYHALAKFGRICKIKLSETQNEEDLYMTPINKTDKNVIRIYQKGTNYLFVARDLINIINKSLSNNVNYFCEALQVKNPYTNLPFSKAILCNIYFFIKMLGIPTPILFHLFFVSGFDLNKFSIDNECFLRDIYIYNYVHNTPATFLYNASILMIYSNNHTQKWMIGEDVDKEGFVKVMRPYLYLHELSKYSLNNDKRHISSIELNRSLKRFYDFNPFFGRKIVTPRRTGCALLPSTSASVMTNLVHPLFHEKTTHSHTTWQCDDDDSPFCYYNNVSQTGDDEDDDEDDDDEE